MTLQKKIAFLGAGNMAGALIEGLLGSGASAANQLHAVDVRSDRLEELRQRHGIAASADAAQAARWADVIVLAVKPQIVDAVLPPLRGVIDGDKLVISVIAGLPTSAIETALGRTVRVVRTMPNTPSIVRAGATAVASGSAATDEDVRVARAIFDSVGISVELPEALLDAVTGLSGSGPAYVFVIIEALIDAGVKCGIPKDAAATLAGQTVLGAARLLVETGEQPGHLKDMVTSPGGTTIAGLHALEAAGIRNALLEAVEAATARSIELGAAHRKHEES